MFICKSDGSESGTTVHSGISGIVRCCMSVKLLQLRRNSSPQAAARLKAIMQMTRPD